MPSLLNRRPRTAALASPWRLLAAGLLALLVSGCQSLPNPVGNADQDTDPALGLEQPSSWLEGEDLDSDSEQFADVWERMRAGYQLQDYIEVNPRIEQQRLWFVSNPSFIEKSSQRGSPYIFYIVEQLEKNNMPQELALLPMIESAYNPLAYSRAHAVGLWQFIPSTGRHFKLKQTNWYDGRRDITASTRAALTYLQYLHDMFNGDWLLALASYNAGEGTVSRAIERNQKLGLPTDYWNLPLPKETRDYVPKLLALSQVVASPEAYGVKLAEIANQPYFERVAFDHRLQLNRLEDMAEIDEGELARLNPAFKQGVTFDGPKHLLVPTDKAELLQASLALLKPEEQLNWQQYKVRSGDSLHSIANRYHVSVNSLKDLNGLKSNHLRIGQALNIPVPPGFKPNQPLHQVTQTASSSRQYRVRQGDNLWSIAKAQRVSVNELKRWNNLPGNALKVGQVLRLQGGQAAAATNSTAGKPTQYRVRQGDSLYLIAKRHKVQLAQLQRWNPQASKALKPGQVLTLYLR